MSGRKHHYAHLAGDAKTKATVQDAHNALKVIEEFSGDPSDVVAQCVTMARLTVLAALMREEVVRAGGGAPQMDAEQLGWVRSAAVFLNRADKEIKGDGDEAPR